jgi:acyl-CoA thioesterase YciA
MKKPRVVESGRSRSGASMPYARAGDQGGARGIMTRDATTDEAARPQGDLTVRTIAMPADTNANGDIFGGWVMSQMDQAGGIAGVERAQGRVVTVAVDGMTFLRPVRVGDVLCVYTQVVGTGRTSMRIQIEAWARRFRTQTREKVTVGVFTFVAIDDEGRPRPIPPAAPGLSP